MKVYESGEKVVLPAWDPMVSTLHIPLHPFLSRLLYFALLYFICDGVLICVYRALWHSDHNSILEA